MDCIFCDIIDGLIPSVSVYQDDRIIAFSDIAPLAPVHVLIVPREHITSAACLTEEHAELMGHIWSMIPIIATKLGVANGFRVVTNVGANAGQTVPHLHFHLLGGRPLNVTIG